MSVVASIATTSSTAAASTYITLVNNLTSNLHLIKKQLYIHLWSPSKFRLKENYTDIRHEDQFNDPRQKFIVMSEELSQIGHD